MANMLSIAAAVVTSLAVALYSAFGLFGLIIALNGFQERDIIWVIVAYILVALVSVIATGWFANSKLSSDSPTILHVIRTTILYVFIGAVSSSAGLFIAVLVANIIGG